MNEAKQRSLLTDLISSKIRLPNIKKIKIDYVSEENKELNSFFKNWVPSKLDFLWVNHISSSNTGIKIGFYIDSISKAIKSVSKEIYLECFEMKESELEQIIKSASNWERLILQNGDIHCSKKLDFSVSSKYKINYLSFKYCGNTYSKDRKTDWISTPSSFRNIVSAISRSGLKDSLQQVNIAANDTLDEDEVQARFNELGMPHISVVEEWTEPIL